MHIDMVCVREIKNLCQNLRRSRLFFSTTLVCARFKNIIGSGLFSAREIQLESNRHRHLTSSRLLDCDEKFSYRSEFALVSCKSQTGFRNFKPVCLWVSHIFIGKKHVVSSRNQELSISSWFHVNSCKNFILVQLHAGLSSSQSHVNTPLPAHEVEGGRGMEVNPLIGYW